MNFLVCTATCDTNNDGTPTVSIELLGAAWTLSDANDLVIAHDRECHGDGEIAVIYRKVGTQMEDE